MESLANPESHLSTSRRQVLRLQPTNRATPLQRISEDAHMTNPTYDARSTTRKRDHQPGYSGVLLRDDLKDRLRTYRRDRGLGDSHIERCLVAACVDLATQPEFEARLRKELARAVAEDFQISTDGPQANESRNPARSPGLR